MLRPFQVNVGSFLTLSHDIPPTARYVSFLFSNSNNLRVHSSLERVSELCSSIEAQSGEKADSQVLLTADGRQMDTRDLIGNYSVGTVYQMILARNIISRVVNTPYFHSNLPVSFTYPTRTAASTSSLWLSIQL